MAEPSTQPSGKLANSPQSPRTAPTSTIQQFEHEPVPRMLERMRKRVEEQTQELCILAYKISCLSPEPDFDTDRDKLQAQHDNLSKAKETLTKSIRNLHETTELFTPGLPSPSLPPLPSIPVPVKNKPHRLPAGLPTFNADTHKENPNHFLRKLELRLETDTYPKRLWPKALAGQISGSGAAWALRNLTKDDVEWDSAKDSFLQHFDHPDHQFTLRQCLFRLKQLHSESVRLYADKFSELVFELGEDDNSELILAQFFHGLRDDLIPLYRMATLSHAPQNLLDASSIAQSLELINVKKDHKETNHESKSQKSNNTSSKAKPNKKQCSYCHRFGHQYEECCKRLAKEGKKDTPPSTTTNNSSSNYSNKTSPYCNYCKEDGHVVNTCPKLQAKQQQS